MSQWHANVHTPDWMVSAVAWLQGLAVYQVLSQVCRRRLAAMRHMLRPTMNGNRMKGKDNKIVVIPNDVCASVIALAQHIEQEEIHIIVQCLMVQEQLGQVAQILAIALLLLAVHLKHGDVAVAVKFVSRRVL